MTTFIISNALCSTFGTPSMCSCNTIFRIFVFVSWIFAAYLPLYLYPFLNSTSSERPFDYLRLTSLGVIGALVKVINQLIRVYLAIMAHSSVVDSLPSLFVVVVKRVICFVVVARVATIAYSDTVKAGKDGFLRYDASTRGVVFRLLQQDDSTVVNFLLQTEIIPLCLRIMETGKELSKTVRCSDNTPE